MSATQGGAQIMVRIRNVIVIILSLAVTLALTNVGAQSEYTLVRFDTPSGTAHGINNRGQVVGEHVGEDLFTAPFVWQNGTLITLDVLGEGQAGVAHDINNRGQIVGSGSIGSGFEVRAILWENGQPVVLDALSSGDFSFSEAYGINDRGLITGVSTDSTGL